VSLKFESGYSIAKNEDDVIIQSNDGICFYVSLSLLGKRSSFFANLASLPREMSLEDKENTLDLPSATSNAICTALRLIIHNDVPDSLKEAVHANLLGKACEVIKDVVIFADAYDFTGLPSELTPHIRPSVWLRFLLAAATDEDQARYISKEIVLLDKGYYRLTVPYAILQTLKELAPGYSERLVELLKTRRVVWAECKIAIPHTAPFENGHEDFGKKCRKRGGCIAMKTFGGSFKKLRRRAAYVATKAIERSAHVYEARGSMGEAIEEEVKCVTCWYRVHKTFERAIQFAFSDVFPHI